MCGKKKGEVEGEKNDGGTACGMKKSKKGGGKKQKASVNHLPPQNQRNTQKNKMASKYKNSETDEAFVKGTVMALAIKKKPTTTKHRMVPSPMW